MRWLLLIVFCASQCVIVALPNVPTWRRVAAVVLAFLAGVIFQVLSEK